MAGTILSITGLDYPRALETSRKVSLTVKVSVVCFDIPNYCKLYL